MTLLKRLQDTRAWLAETNGAKHVSPKLTLAELDQILAALEPWRDPMLPLGTRRSQQEIDTILETRRTFKRKQLA